LLFFLIKRIPRWLSKNLIIFFIAQETEKNGRWIRRLGVDGFEGKITDERRAERRTLQDAQNPFDLPRNEFMNIFRISPELAMDLTNLLRPDLWRQRMNGISLEFQVICTCTIMYCYQFVVHFLHFILLIVWRQSFWS